MPWTCKTYGAEVQLDLPDCPQCPEGHKSAWTVFQDRTRTLALPGKSKLYVLRGEETEPGYDLEDGTFNDTEVAPVLPKSAARRLVLTNQVPAPSHVLAVRVEASSSKDPTITLGLDFATQELQNQSFPPEAEAEGAHQVPFLLVYGPGPVDDLVFGEGVQVLDVTEGTRRGFPPAVEVSALKKKPRSLPTVDALERTIIHFLEVEDVCFETNRAVFLPEPLEPPAATPGEHEHIAGLNVISTVLELFERAPHKRLLVAGHTDTQGGADHNLELSRQRAKNVHLYLTGEKAEWAQHCAERYDISDYQRVLRWVHRTFGWDVDPGPIDGDFGDQTRDARDRFRDTFNTKRGGDLERHVKQNAADFEAYYDLYDEALVGLLGVEPEELQAFRDRLAFADPATVGCGENWPIEAVGVDGFESDANRRVDLLFFDDHDLPEAFDCHLAGGCDPRGCPIYQGDRYLAEYLPVDLDDFIDPDAPFELWARLFDEAGLVPLPGLEWKVELSDGRTVSGTTNDDAELREIDVPVGHFHLEVETEGAEPVTISSLRSPRRPLTVRVVGVEREAPPTKGVDRLPSIDVDYDGAPEDEDVGGQDA